MSEQESGQSGSIVIVDDNPVNLRLLAELLTGCGYKVRPASNGVRALATIEKEVPDLILLDVMMPEMDGFEVCRKLQANEHTACIPVIIISARDEVFDKIEAFSCGSVDYITKPFQTEEVLARIKTHLTLSSLRKQLEEKNTLLKKVNLKLEKISRLDGLTGIPNRRYFDEMLEKEWQRAVRESSHFALLMIDIDNFKKYNDHYGHLKGDKCLKKVAASIVKSMHRPGDFAARYGGEEFCVILPGVNLEGALMVGESVCANVKNLGVSHCKSDVCGKVTVSVGVASSVPEHGLKPSSLLKKSDEAMYEAKKQGRNRVVPHNANDG